MASSKDPGAFKTIGELSEQLGVAQHILRYWETKFPQLKPLQRAGNRRYYRPADAALATRIHDLLANHGYTIRGVQRLLGSKVDAPIAADTTEMFAADAPAIPLLAEPETPALAASAVDLDRIARLRHRLVAALGE